MQGSENGKSLFWKLFCLLALGLWGCVNDPGEDVSKKEATLVFLDVGQGLAVLLEQEGQYALFDAGPDSAGVVDSLVARGVDTLEWVVVSHNHRDHFGGLLEVFSLGGPGEGAFENRRGGTWEERREVASPRVHIRRLIVGPDTSGGFLRDSVLRAARRLKVPVDTLGRGGRLALGSELRFECLWPPEYMAVGENHASIVLRAETSDGAGGVPRAVPSGNVPRFVSSGGVPLAVPSGNVPQVVSSGGRGLVLLTGDLDSVGENRLLEMNVDLSADLLQVGHHGSAGSSSLRFLNGVSPRQAVISVGAGNSYGHPAESVMRKLQYVLGDPADSTRSSSILRTDLDGSVTFKIIPGVGVVQE